MSATTQGSIVSPRIGIAGIAIESSTFTPYRSGQDDFEVRRGTAEILDRYPFEPPAAEYVGVLHARALPGGPLDRDTYEGWKAEIEIGRASCRERVWGTVGGGSAREEQSETREDAHRDEV